MNIAKVFKIRQEKHVKRLGIPFRKLSSTVTLETESWKGGRGGGRVERAGDRDTVGIFCAREHSQPDLGGAWG